MHKYTQHRNHPVKVAAQYHDKSLCKIVIQLKRRDILSYRIRLSVCVSVCNRLPNHAYCGDETLTGDSMGLE